MTKVEDLQGRVLIAPQDEVTWVLYIGRDSWWTRDSTNVQYDEVHSCRLYQIGHCLDITGKTDLTSDSLSGPVLTGFR